MDEEVLTNWESYTFSLYEEMLQMIEKTGQVIRCSVEQTSRFSKKIRMKLLTDDGLHHHDLMFIDNYSGYVPIVGTRITIRMQGNMVVEVIDVNGVPPQMQNQSKDSTNASGSQVALAALVIISGVLLILVGFGNPYVGVLLLVLGGVQIIVGFMLHQTLRREVAFLAFILNLFSLMVHVVPLGGGSSAYINPATILFQLLLILLQTSLLCAFLCPKSMEMYYG